MSPTNNPIKTIGFAGIGTMGTGMCKNLVSKGFTLFVYNRTKEKAHAIQGAIVVDTPAELCRHAQLIFTCVTNDAALKDILYSQHGVMSTLGSGNILVDSSTTSVPVTAQIAKDCEAKQAKFLDAPLTGSKPAADKGTLLMMIGGEREVFEHCRPVFDAVGKKLVYCGLNTYGQRVKIALNLTQGMILESYLEGIALALKEGLSLDAIRDVFDNAGSWNNVAAAKMPTIVQRDFTPIFLLDLMNKDMKLAEQEMKKLGIKLPLAESVIMIFGECMDMGLAKQDWSAMVKLLEKRAGVEIVQR